MSRLLSFPSCPSPAHSQCHKSHAFLVWRKRYEEATAHRSSAKGQMKLLEYRPPSAQPGLWRKVVASKKSLLLFGPDSRARRCCRWLTSPAALAVPSDPLNTGEHEHVTTGSITKGVLRPGAGSFKGAPPPPGGGPRQHQGRWKRFLGRGEGGSNKQKNHRLARAAVQAVEVCAIVATLVVVSFDVEVSSGRRAAADKTGAVRLVEAVAVSAFLAEALALIVARGLVLLPGAYLRDPSNVLELSLTVLSAVCLLWPLGGGTAAGAGGGGDPPLLSAVKALRALNVLRLARFARLSCSLMDLLRALRSSGKALCLAWAMVLSFWVQWSIVGLQVSISLSPT